MRSAFWIFLISVVIFLGYLYATGHFAKPRPPTGLTASAAGLQPGAPQAVATARGRHGDRAAGRDIVSTPVIRRDSPKPFYPDLAMARHEEGQVLLRIHVAKDGRALDAKLDRSSGYSRLDSAAMSAAMKLWRYRPGRLNGEPVAMWHQVKVTFTCSADGQDRCDGSF